MKLTSEWEIHNRQYSLLTRPTPKYFFQPACDPNRPQRVLVQQIHMFQQLCKEPMQRVMKTDPSLRYIEFKRMESCPAKLDPVEGWNGKLRPVETVLGERAHHKDLVHHRTDGANELCARRVRKRLAEHLDYATQAEGNVEYADPRIRLVLDVCLDSAFVRV